jgi:hypothetical protein
MCGSAKRDLQVHFYFWEFRQIGCPTSLEQKLKSQTSFKLNLLSTSENGLALSIWSIETQVVTKRVVDNQIESLIFNH